MIPQKRQQEEGVPVVVKIQIILTMPTATVVPIARLVSLDRVVLCGSDASCRKFRLHGNCATIRLPGFRFSYGV